MPRLLIDSLLSHIYSLSLTLRAEFYMFKLTFHARARMLLNLRDPNMKSDISFVVTRGCFVLGVHYFVYSVMT